MKAYTEAVLQVCDILKDGKHIREIYIWHVALVALHKAKLIFRLSTGIFTSTDTFLKPKKAAEKRGKFRRKNH